MRVDTYNKNFGYKFPFHIESDAKDRDIIRHGESFNVSEKIKYYRFLETTYMKKGRKLIPVCEQPRG